MLALAGGTEGWARSGRPLESGQGEMLSPALDVDRRPYEGTGIDPAVMQDRRGPYDASGRRLGRLTTMASWLLRAMTTTASSAPGFSSRCGTYGGTKM